MQCVRSSDKEVYVQMLPHVVLLIISFMVVCITNLNNCLAEKQNLLECLACYHIALLLPPLTFVEISYWENLVRLFIK